MDLSVKYNIPAPRYTSYPTVPYWDNNIDETVWKQHVKESFRVNNRKKGISLYIHLPYCESLCTYCACNTRITVNHAVEEPYVKTLIEEWKLYTGLFEERPVLRELHLGGGTPTFFSPANLRMLISEILRSVSVHEDHAFSFEAHPANTTHEHLKVLYELGFRRVSFGIQDFDEKIQDAIHRFQTFEQVDAIVTDARKMGYDSVNFDLIYGLPFQSLESIRSTVDKVIKLRPDRIAFYSYAHVPWMKPGQRKYSEKDLPSGEDKQALYLEGRKMFAQNGYHDVGMDHFALATDSLYESFVSGKLHRNFMGYTDMNTGLLLALGCSSISDAGTAMMQNHKVPEEYMEAIAKGKFSVYKGHVLTERDMEIREAILDIMCRGNAEFSMSGEERKRMQDVVSDGLAEISGNHIKVTEKGRLFVRNISMNLDERYWSSVPDKPKFSQAV